MGSVVVPQPPKGTEPTSLVSQIGLWIPFNIGIYFHKMYSHTAEQKTTIHRHMSWSAVVKKSYW